MTEKIMFYKVVAFTFSIAQSTLESCLEKIHPDNLLEEFAKISPPEALSPIKE